MTQVKKIHRFGWATNDRCKKSADVGSEKHHVCCCKVWRQTRYELEYEVRRFEHKAATDEKRWL